MTTMNVLNVNEEEKCGLTHVDLDELTSVPTGFLPENVIMTAEGIMKGDPSKPQAEAIIEAMHAREEVLTNLLEAAGYTATNGLLPEQIIA